MTTETIPIDLFPLFHRGDFYKYAELSDDVRMCALMSIFQTPELYKALNMTDYEREQVDLSKFHKHKLSLYGSIILLVLGIPSNIIIIRILRSDSLKYNFVAQFLLYIAVFNIINLFVFFSRYFTLGYFHHDIRLYSQFSCVFHFSVSTACHMIDNWIMMCVSVCKYMFVKNSSRANTICYKGLVHTVSLTILVIAVSVNFFAAFGQREMFSWQHEEGQLACCDWKYLTGYSVIEMFLVYCFPACMVILLNLDILFTYSRHMRRVKGFHPHLHKKFQRALILAFLIFLSDLQLILAEIPYIIFNMFRPLFCEATILGKARCDVVYIAVLMILHFNYSMNILIYCFFGNHFKSELLYLIATCKGLICYIEASVSGTTSTEIEESERSPTDIEDEEYQLERQARQPLSTRASVLSLTDIFRDQSTVSPRHLQHHRSRLSHHHSWTSSKTRVMPQEHEKKPDSMVQDSGGEDDEV